MLAFVEARYFGLVDEVEMEQETTLDGVGSFLFYHNVTNSSRAFSPRAVFFTGKLD